jgi:ABC-type Fe3+/spermidine/putrescine transport system ATPase subunit
LDLQKPLFFLDGVAMAIRIESISKWFGENRVVNQLSLDVNDREFLVLLGPSGSGKSTVLRMVAGLLVPDEGRILLDGTDITQVPPQQRGFGYVFQNYSIFPHMTVAENIEYGLRIRKVALSERRARGTHLLELVGLVGLGDRYAGQLSGGQLQRVALARSLAYDPKVLLLDEPFGALDAKIRVQLRQSVKRVVREIGVTAVMVTHDQDEAFELADRVAVINQGCLEQVGCADDIYYNPSAHFIADFVGDINFIEGRVTEAGKETCSIELPGGSVACRRGYYSFQPRQPVLYGIRPEQMRVSLLEPESYENGIRGLIEKSLFLGDTTEYAIRLSDNHLLNVKVLNYLFVDGMVMPYELSEHIWLIWSQGSGIILERESTKQGKLL